MSLSYLEMLDDENGSLLFYDCVERNVKRAFFRNGINWANYDMIHVLVSKNFGALANRVLDYFPDELSHVIWKIQTRGQDVDTLS